VQHLLCKTLTKQASGEPFTDPLAAPSLVSSSSFVDNSVLSKRKAEEDTGGLDKKPKKYL
jgi:hypothetical protein